MIRVGRSVVALTLSGPVAPALAHTPGASADIWEWVVPGVIAVAALLYLRGVRRLGSACRAAGVTRKAVIHYFVGSAALLVALVPPFDRYADRYFSLHMIQHEALMLVAAPLLALGRPYVPYLHALPRAMRRGCMRALHASGLRAAVELIARPTTAWALHAGTLWLWHAPILFNAAIAHTGVHVAQHLSFLVTALLFWRSVLPGVGVPTMAAAVSLFATALHSNALGALLTFAGAPLYAYDDGVFGLTAHEDQQLGGLIMWVPAGLVYLYAALLVSARALRLSEGSRYDAT